MTSATTSNDLLRARRAHEHGRVTFVELFFDLVFVFAVTQLSHLLLEHLSIAGMVETALLLMAVWWVWIFTSWVTNWLDPQRAPVRLLLYALMLAGLVLSTSIPESFGSRGFAFAAAYAFMQVGRSLFMLWVLRHHSAGNLRNFQRITVWLALAGVFWLAGGVAHGELRLGLWVLALFLEYLSPAVGFWVPGLGRSTTADWDIEGAHMAERCGLFIIIALGESILVTGVTFGNLEWSVPTAAAFAGAFAGSVAMWWIYFDVGAETAAHRISTSPDPGRLGRLAYTYIHLVLVAGIIVAAVADELVLVHPTGHTDIKTATAVLAGPALYLLGNSLFKRTIYGRLPLSHMVGLLLLALLIAAIPVSSPLTFGTMATLVLALVAVWETLFPQATAA